MDAANSSRLHSSWNKGNANDITYYYTSRLPGEPAEGVNDLHSHPMESRTVRLGLLCNF